MVPLMAEVSRLIILSLLSPFPLSKWSRESQGPPFNNKNTGVDTISFFATTFFIVFFIKKAFNSKPLILEAMTSTKPNYSNQKSQTSLERVKKSLELKNKYRI